MKIEELKTKRTEILEEHFQVIEKRLHMDVELGNIRGRQTVLEGEAMNLGIEIHLRESGLSEELTHKTLEYLHSPKNLAPLTEQPATKEKANV